MSNTYRIEEAVFAKVVELQGTHREALLAKECGSNCDLKQAVEALLREHDQRGMDFLAPLETSLSSLLRRYRMEPVDEQLGALVGNYKLMEKVGEGGCGVVYLAKQEEPVCREVALKIIKLGMDTREVIRRFEMERQALARMDHPNIARVFDAGATPSGRPYFVMELVLGVSLTRYCNEARLPVPERLGLFNDVCRAIQHAHQKGIIHRDIKPSNILVALHDGRPVPKVIDFGVAKATETKLTERTAFTAMAQLIGTPAYMSPEQAAFSSSDVDTRSDVYSLGVLLYELLAGCTPFDSKELVEAGLDEMRKRIREVEPARPSMRVARMEIGARREAAERARATAAKLQDLLAGDLDRVVMKCLEKSPGRRYESVSALIQDIERFLHHEPVSAGPANQWYTWGKFIRRNRLAFAIAGAIGLLLVIAVAVSTSLLIREKAALTRAIAAEHAQLRAREEAENAVRQAKTEVARSARVTDFMKSVLDGAKPAVARGRDTELLRELLDEAAVRLDSVLQDDADVEAELRDVIGQAFWHLDEPGKSESMHRRALELHERTWGPNHPKVAFTLLRLGLFEMYHGAEKEAESFFRRAADIRLRLWGPDDPRTLDVQFFLVESLSRQKRYSESIELLERVRSVQMRTMAADDLRLLRTDFLLSGLLERDGAVSAAERMLRTISASYPADTGGQSLSLFRHQPLESLSGLLVDQGRIEEAVEVLRRSVAAAKAQGASSIASESRLAHALHRLGKCSEAQALFRVSTENARQLYLRDKSRRFVGLLASSTIRQAECFAQAGRPLEGEPLLREACALSFRHSKMVPRHPAFALAKLLEGEGRRDEANAVFEDALSHANREGSEFVFQLLPRVLQSLNPTRSPEELIRAQLASEASWIERNGPIAAAPYSLAVLCGAAVAGEFERIAPVVRARLAWWKENRPGEAPTHAYGILAGEVLLAERQWEEAERALLNAAEGLERTKDYWRFDPIWRGEYPNGALTRLYATWNPPEEPGRWRRLMTREVVDAEWETILARILFNAGRYREAREILPGARNRLAELLAQKPEHDRLRAIQEQISSLWRDCSKRLGLESEAELLGK